jgi:FlaA1/EpsC-like NDP-sugar epimerase
MLRYDKLSIHIPHFGVGGLVATSAVAACAQLLVGTGNGLYRGRWRVASFEGIGALAGTCLLIVSGLLVLNLFDGYLVPESVPIIGGVAALILMLSDRYVARLVIEQHRRPGGEGCARLLIFGAGQAAEEVIATMLRSPDSPYLPVALLDDNLARRHRSIMGVPVAGNRYDMANAKERFGADTLLIAIRSGSGPLHRELARLATEADLTVKVLPSREQRSRMTSGGRRSKICSGGERSRPISRPRRLTSRAGGCS